MTEEPPPALQRLLEQAPFVRLLAQALLAEQADEVVQRTWLLAVRHGGDGVERPRSWLARVVRNIARNLRRDENRRRRHEREGASGGIVPSSAELLQQEEQRRSLVAAVDRLPPPLRAVVLLRFFEGLPPRRIAAQLGVPVATVWTQLRRALQLLRERLDAEHGGERRAWMVPLVPFAAHPHGLPAGATTTASALGLGGLLMTMKTKLVATIAAMLAVALALWAARDHVPPGAVSPVEHDEAAAVATADVTRDAVAPDAARREVVIGDTTPPPTTTGSLVVHVRYGSDRTPAAGVTMIARRSGAEGRGPSLRRRSDANGEVAFDDLAAGRVHVTSDRFTTKRVEVRAGETVDLDFDLDVGVLLTGIVVDEVGTPIAGAEIDVVSLASAEDFEAIAVSGADGRFAVRDAPYLMLVGARAAGYCASVVQVCQSRPGNEAEFRLQLGPPGGSVDGVVIDERGRAIAGALVCIGSADAHGNPIQNGVAPALPALARSDEQGRFRAIGVPPGTQVAQARAGDFAPWRGTCEVAANLTSPLRIVMSPGAAIRGTVLSATGEPAAGAFVKVGDWRDFARYVTRTAADGSFEIEGLPVGEVVLEAHHGTLGEAEQVVSTAAGVRHTCEVRLSTGIVLRCRVVGEAGEPIASASVVCTAKGAEPGWGRVESDEHGWFTMPNCPAGEAIFIHVEAAGREPLERTGVQPTREPIELRMGRLLPMGTARITGVVTAPDGAPVANALVGSTRVGGGSSGGTVTRADGRFDLAQLVPGTWRISVRAPGYPLFFSEHRPVAANATWDMGSVTLPQGGTARVTIDGDRTDVWFQLVDASGRARTDWAEDNGTLVVSPDLMPGEHRLLVSGKAVAAQSIPFVVRAGEATRLAVKLSPGVRQRFELTAPTLDPLPRLVRLDIRRDDQLLRTTGVAMQAGQASGNEACLSPGDYTVAAFDGDRKLAAASFLVGSNEGPPLRLELR